MYFMYFIIKTYLCDSDIKRPADAMYAIAYLFLLDYCYIIVAKTIN